jgi:hypothetical protein
VYNPNILDPPDNPNAVWCDYCGEQMFDDDIEYAYDTLDGHLVHEGCLPEYTWAVEKRMEMLYKKIEKMVERGLS